MAECQGCIYSCQAGPIGATVEDALAEGCRLEHLILVPKPKTS